MSTQNEIVYESSNLPSKNYQFFGEMRRNGKLCDITFNVDSRSVSAHRIVLAAGIPYFRDTILSENIDESLEKVIEIPEIDYHAFVALIEFLYSCKITITTENVLNLLSAACVLQIDEVRDVCCKFLESNSNPESLLNIRVIALNLGLSSLMQTTDFCIRKNFEEVSKSEEFENLPCSYLIELIRGDNLQVSSEEKVYEAVIRWVKRSPFQRSSELPELLRNVRMTHLKPQYLVDVVSVEELIRASTVCRDILDEAKNHHLFPEKKQKLFSFCTTFRHFVEGEHSNSMTSSQTEECKSLDLLNYATEDIGMLGICTLEAKTTCTLQCFDIERKEWKTFKSKTVFHKNGAVTEMDGKIYLFNETFGLKYDTKLDDLTFLIGDNRTLTGVAHLNSELYICGGTHGSSAMNKVQKYCPRNDECTNITSMNSRRISPGVVSLGQCIYVIGGYNRYVFKSVEIYNVEEDEWTLGKPMLCRRHAAGCTVLGGKIYVCGGKSGLGCLQSAEVFDPKTNMWTFICNLNTPRCRFRLLPYYGKLYALGGLDADGNFINTVEVYDLETNVWEFGTPLNPDVKNPNVVVITG